MKQYTFFYFDMAESDGRDPRASGFAEAAVEGIRQTTGQTGKRALALPDYYVDVGGGEVTKKCRALQNVSKGMLSITVVSAPLY